MINSVNIVSMLCILTILSFSIYSYLNYLESSNQTNFITSHKNNDIKISECPDFFEIMDANGKIKCKNTYKLGKCKIKPGNNTVSFDDDLFTNIKNGNNNKCEWARECETPWQNISRLC